MPLDSNGEPDYEAIEKIIMMDENAKINLESPMDRDETKHIESNTGTVKRNRELLNPYDFSDVPDEPDELEQTEQVVTTEQADSANTVSDSVEPQVAVEEQQPVPETTEPEIPVKSEPEIPVKSEPVKQTVRPVNSSRFNIAITGLSTS